MANKRKRIKYSKSDLSFLCEWDECRIVHPTVDSLIRHIEMHLAVCKQSLQVLEDEAISSYVCRWCGCNAEVKGNWSDFSRHVLFHAFHVKIKEFGRVFTKKSNMSIDMCSAAEESRNLLPELPEHLCCGWKDCEEIYDNAEYFYRHVNQHIEIEDKDKNGFITCLWDGCTFAPAARFRLKEHIRSHTQEKLIACPNCGALFSCRTKLLDHLEKQGHHQGLCYQCVHCSKMFANQRLLRDHMRRHVNNYKCDLCDMTLPNPSGIKKHMLYRHSTERPLPCNQCNSAFKHVNDLRKHMLNNHDKCIVYSCVVEGCSFTSHDYSSLTVHLNKHDNEKQRYACHVCDSKFARGTQLTQHLKSEHKYKWPSGHNRFRYVPHEDGYMRLQTVRFESVLLLEKSGDHSADESLGITEVAETSSNSHEGDPRTESAPIPINVRDDDCTYVVDDGSYNLAMLVDIATQQPVTNSSSSPIHISEPTTRNIPSTQTENTLLQTS